MNWLVELPALFQKRTPRPVSASLSINVALPKPAPMQSFLFRGRKLPAFALTKLTAGRRTKSALRSSVNTRTSWSQKMIKTSKNFQRGLVYLTGSMQEWPLHLVTSPVFETTISRVYPVPSTNVFDKTPSGIWPSANTRTPAGT